MLYDEKHVRFNDTIQDEQIIEQLVPSASSISFTSKLGGMVARAVESVQDLAGKFRPIYANAITEQQQELKVDTNISPTSSEQEQATCGQCSCSVLNGECCRGCTTNSDRSACDCTSCYAGFIHSRGTSKDCSEFSNYSNPVSSNNSNSYENSTSMKSDESSSRELSNISSKMSSVCISINKSNNDNIEIINNELQQIFSNSLSIISNIDADNVVNSTYSQTTYSQDTLRPPYSPNNTLSQIINTRYNKHIDNSSNPHSLTALSNTSKSTDQSSSPEYNRISNGDLNNSTNNLSNTSSDPALSKISAFTQGNDSKLSNVSSNSTQASSLNPSRFSNKHSNTASYESVTSSYNPSIAKDHAPNYASSCFSSEQLVSDNSSNNESDQEQYISTFDYTLSGNTSKYLSDQIYNVYSSNPCQDESDEDDVNTSQCCSNSSFSNETESSRKSEVTPEKQLQNR